MGQVSCRKFKTRNKVQLHFSRHEPHTSVDTSLRTLTSASVGGEGHLHTPVALIPWKQTPSAH